MWQSVLIFILASLVQFVSLNMIFFSSQTQYFQMNWRFLSLLSIFELLVKLIWQYNADFPQNLARTLARQYSRTISRTIEVLFFPHNFTPKSVFFFFFFFFFSTNLEVRCFNPATKSLIFTNLAIGIYICTVQETSRHVFDKLRVQKRFRIQLVL